jgi:Tol biopolymer transport system component
MSVEGENVKEVCTAQEDKVFRMALWSPDGKYIYFTERSEKPNLWRIPAEGGKPQKVWSSKNSLDIFSFHPDGNQVAFSIPERTTEVRVIENLVKELEKLDKMDE